MKCLKKAICLCLLATVLAVGITLITPRSQAATYGKLTYSVTNGEVTITACEANISGAMVIPETIEGYPVTAISAGVFWRRSMTSLTIPDTVKTIGSGAFDFCISLSTVRLGKGIETIGNNAFRDCSGLTVYYNGTQEMWNKINIGTGNEALTKNAIIFPEHFDHPACGAVCEHEQPHEDLSSTKWTGGTLYSGDYYLGADLTLSKQITVSKPVRLCLNGYKLTFTAGYGITVNEGASLELCDCLGTGELIRDKGTSSSDGSILANHGTMTIYSGKYCLNGDGVSVYNSGTMDIYGGTYGIDLYNSNIATIYQATIEAPKTEGILNSTGSTLNIYDCTVTSYSYALRNLGTATIYGGTFHTTRNDDIGCDCVVNEGVLNIYDATISAEKGDGIYNSYNSSSSNKGYLNFYGGTVTANAQYKAAIYNRKSLTVSGGTLSGYMGIYNGSALSGTTTNGGTCTVSGGTVSGSFCGIHNSGNTYTEYVSGVGTKKWSKATLTVSGKPEISKILLDYPESITLNYNGTTPVALEIDPEDFAVGKTVWSYSPAKMQQVDLVNEGYVLQYKYPNVIFATNGCGIDGENLRWDLTNDGKLTIYGTGDMDDFGFSSNQPWNKEKTYIDVTQVTIEPGVTSIGSAAFSYISGLTQIHIPEGVTSINSWAFEGCEALEEIWLPATLTTIERNIFTGCSEPPKKMYYAGCIHQWEQIEIGSQAWEFAPVCAQNTNTDDGDCTTAVLCSVCGGVDVAARETHTGGVATCTELAQCEICGTAYGDYGHMFDQETAADAYLKDAATCTEGAYYFKHCACGAVSEDLLFRTEALGHIDANTDHICDRDCGKTDVNIDLHLDATTDKDHICDYGCGAVLEQCFDAENDADHACDICDAADISEHSGNPADCENDSVCTECAAVITPALGHSYEATFLWDDTHKACVATISCARGCGEKEVLDCAVSDSREDPSVTVHTAAVSYSGETFTDTLTCRNYLVTFANWDSAVLQAEYYHPGETVTAPADPERPADVQYTYSFVGWDRPVAVCTGEAVYTACYYPVEITYIVKFVDWNGKTLASGAYYYGEAVTAPKHPDRPADDVYTYHFTNWDQELVCSGNMTVTAVYEARYIDYTVTFRDWDGREISSATYHYGDPVSVPDVSARPADNACTYTYAGWDTPVTACTGNAVYTATYTATYIEYTITFLNWNGAVIATQTYHYGDTVTPPADPVRPSDVRFAYRFTGWDAPVTECVADAVYRACFEAEKICYSVVFRYADGTVISSKDYHYGDMVQIPDNVTLENFRFIGWDQEVSDVCLGNAVYTALFESVAVPGDINIDGDLNNDDVVLLLWHTLFPEEYSLTVDGDINIDGDITNDDVVLLLWHTLFPEEYPLPTKKK